MSKWDCYLCSERSNVPTEYSPAPVFRSEQFWARDFERLILKCFRSHCRGRRSAPPVLPPPLYPLSSPTSLSHWLRVASSRTGAKIGSAPHILTMVVPYGTVGRREVLVQFKKKKKKKVVYQTAPCILSTGCPRIFRNENKTFIRLCKTVLCQKIRPLSPLRKVNDI